MLNLTAIRKEFPILSQKINGHPLVYLDSAATAQKPEAVLARMEEFYREENSNVHRGMHVLAERATVAFEQARVVVQHFVNAPHSDEIVFTKSCTESVNLVAQAWGRANLKKGDVVVLTMLEHHSNIVPWLQLKEQIGITLQWVDIDDRGELDLRMLEGFLKGGNVKMLAMTAQSNVLGVSPPLNSIISLAHKHGALVLVDAAQSIAHHSTDVQAIDCDFLAFSGHKLYGPSGIGVLYGKREILTAMPPFLGGGMMIKEVTTERFSPADSPAKFEAGTPPLAEAIGLDAAITWLSQHSWRHIEEHDRELVSTLLNVLRSVPGVRILGPADPEKISGCVSFVVEGAHPHDITDILGRQGICLRAGHHCAQPLHRRLGIVSSTRVSVGMYNTIDEIRSLGPALTDAIGTLAGR